MEYPFWVYHPKAPSTLEQCTSAKLWNKYRRHRWRIVDPKIVADRLQKYVASTGLTLAEFAKVMLNRGTWLSYHELSLLFHGLGPAAMCDEHRLSHIADLWHLPVTYLYGDGTDAVPNIFQARKRALVAFAPPALSSAVVQSKDDAEGLEPVLRMYHILYTRDGTHTYHRAHVLAHSDARAQQYLETRYPTAIVKEISSQQAVPGLFLETY